MITYIFRKLWILNRFFYIYFLNMDISLDIKFSVMKLFTDDYKIHVEGSVSQNFKLGLSFIFMSKNRKLFVNFSNFIF